MKRKRDPKTGLLTATVQEEHEVTQELLGSAVGGLQKAAYDLEQIGDDLAATAGCIRDLLQALE